MAPLQKTAEERIEAAGFTVTCAREGLLRDLGGGKREWRDGRYLAERRMPGGVKVELNSSKSLEDLAGKVDAWAGTPRVVPAPVAVEHGSGSAGPKANVYDLVGPDDDEPGAVAA